MTRKYSEIVTADTRDHALEKMKAVELVPTSRNNNGSCIIVRIGNCSIRVTDHTDLSLLRKISEAFDND